MSQLTRRYRLIFTIAACTLVVTGLVSPVTAEDLPGGPQLLDVELAAPEIATPESAIPVTRSENVNSYAAAQQPFVVLRTTKLPYVAAHPANLTSASQNGVYGDQSTLDALASASAAALNNANTGSLRNDFAARPLLPQNYRLSDVGARIAQVAQEKNLGGAAYSRRHLCQMLLRETVQRVTPVYNRYFSDTALKTMRAFQSAGIGRAYRADMQLLPGDLLYTARWGGGFGHAMVVGPDGRIRDNVSSGVATPWQRPIDWVVRPDDNYVRLASRR